MFQRPNIQPAAEPIINNKQVLAQAVVPEQSANQITGLEIIPWQPVGSAIALHILADFIDFRQRARRVQPEVHTESQGSGSQEMISMGLASEGFYQVHSCRVDRHHSPLRLTKPVPSELVGLCFNCLASSHVKAVCNCWVEGHRRLAVLRRSCGGGGLPVAIPVALLTLLQPTQLLWAAQPLFQDAAPHSPYLRHRLPRRLRLRSLRLRWRGCRCLMCHMR
jgi:hypothetical protein